jgi:L-lysine 2,3-aminomutase
MSSFSNPHYMYLFELKDALEILHMRLSDAEMAQIEREQYTKISQRDLQKYVGELG